MKIDIPKILLELRAEGPHDRIEHAVFRAFAFAATRPKFWRRITAVGRKFPVPLVAPVKAWLSQRELPPVAPKSFREMWRERNQ